MVTARNGNYLSTPNVAVVVQQRGRALEGVNENKEREREGERERGGEGEGTLTYHSHRRFFSFLFLLLRFLRAMKRHFACN